MTVSALNRAVAGLLSRSFPLVRVRGEIANLARAASGHWYFTLKDAAAQVRCAMYRPRNALVNFTPRDGDEVEVLARVGLYETRGEYQLNVEAMQRAGLGRLFEEFVRLKERLAAEGLFSAALKRPLPALPHAIGIVTSMQAAALRDVLTTLRRRAPYVRLIVYPAPVQGEGAAVRIAQMLAQVSMRNEVDVVLLVRGGGSIEDLWAFNEEVVARAIRSSTIPIVVGVGHESDFTIADFAADARAATPTAAAEIVAPDRAGLLDAFGQRLRALRGGARRRLDFLQQRHDYAMRSLAMPRAPLIGLDARLTGLLGRLGQLARQALSVRQLALVRSTQWLSQLRPGAQPARVRVQELRARLAARLQRGQKAHHGRLESLSAALTALDPSAVLARGYAMALTVDGHCVREARQLSRGDRLRLRFARGEAIARVESLDQELGHPPG